ncbi:hypothetical protein BU15DRAFT_82893 [Melanogaster broomeanus]|nr:hypothetical protein BU15DRAFT_82893 [Melanogaster broomeanus]
MPAPLFSTTSLSVSEALSPSSLLSPPTRGPTTSRSTMQLSPSDFASTFSSTFTVSKSATDASNIMPTASSLRRPQMSPRSPLTSVRSIVAAWKERTPSLGKPQLSTESTVSPPTKIEGLFSLRKRAPRAENHPREHASSSIAPLFDMTESGAYARNSREPLHIGDTSTCILTLLIDGNVAKHFCICICCCFLGSLHAELQGDVGTIATLTQVAEGDCPHLVELLCPSQLIYGDGRLWHRSCRVVSEAGSPTGSIRTICSMTSSTSGSGSGSASTAFVPPLHAIPSLSDLHTFSDTSSTGPLSRAPSFPTRHARTTDDTAVSNQSYLYPGDPRVIGPSRSSSLCRTGSLTQADLDEEFASAVSRARTAKPSLASGLSLVGGFLGDGSPVTVQRSQAW